jgi:hypothetical protein
MVGYTDASESIIRGIYDASKTNAKCFLNYHSLNLRCDRRYNFKSTNLIMYFAVWNAYGRKNVATYWWNEMKNKQGKSYQWSFVPVFGLEFEY